MKTGGFIVSETTYNYLMLLISSSFWKDKAAMYFLKDIGFLFKISFEAFLCSNLSVNRVLSYLLTLNRVAASAFRFFNERHPYCKLIYEF